MKLIFYSLYIIQFFFRHIFCSGNLKDLEQTLNRKNLSIFNTKLNISRIKTDIIIREKLLNKAISTKADPSEFKIALDRFKKELLEAENLLKRYEMEYSEALRLKNSLKQLKFSN